MDVSARILSYSDALQALKDRPREYSSGYRAMYSSYLGGIVTDPALMIVPIDDHVVHRGDGVFEAIKFAGRKVYGFEAHLKRLERSASFAQLSLPGGIDSIRALSLATCAASGLSDGLIRLYVSRGPGGFTANPYESVGSQLYVVVTTLAAPAAAKIKDGVSCKFSSIPVKESWFATVKSCNYLPNVLMKKEAVDSGVDFVVSLDERGLLAEGSTENFAVVTHSGEFKTPKFDRVLRGVTLTRAMSLARSLVSDGLLTGLAEADVSRADVEHAREILFFGTTIDALPVTRFEGKPVGSGAPGPVFQRIHELIQSDLRSGADVLTPF